MARNDRQNTVVVVPKYWCVGSKNRCPFPVSRQITGGALFVEPSEEHRYRKLYNIAWSVQVLPQNNGGFGALLHAMWRHAMIQNWPLYWFCDDDVLAFKARDKNLWSRHIHLMESFMTEHPACGQLMMSFQGHNWYEKRDVKWQVGAWCVVLNRTEAITAVGGPDVDLPIFNDWDLSARLIQGGWKTACYFPCMFAHRMKSHDGGAMTIYRQPEMLERAIDILTTRYGAHCVRRVQAHGQTEARFKWSQLFKSTVVRGDTRLLCPDDL